MNELQTITTDYQKLHDHFMELQDVSETSRKAYSRALWRFFKWTQGEGLEVQTIRKPDILRYKESMHDLSQYSIGLYMTVVRKFFQAVEDETPDYRSPCRGVKGGKVNSRVYCKDALNKRQIRDLLKSIDNKRDMAMIMLMVHAGLRTIEVARANIEDLRNKGSKEVLYVQGKGSDSKDDFVVLPENVLKALRAYLRTRRGKKPEDPLFVNQLKNGHVKRLHTGSISRIVKEYLRGVGIDDPRITAHSLRHSTATVAYYAGVPIEGIQGLMRHSQITTTMKYVHTLKKTESNYEQLIADFLVA
jgi:site-specific recombinase XerD